MVQFLFVCLFGFLFFPHHAARGILVLRPGIEPTPPALEAQSLNHWAAREVPVQFVSMVYLSMIF